MLRWEAPSLSEQSSDRCSPYRPVPLAEKRGAAQQHSSAAAQQHSSPRPPRRCRQVALSARAALSGARPPPGRTTRLPQRSGSGVSAVGDGAAHFSQARADIAAVKSSCQRAVIEPMNLSGCRADAARTARVSADNHQQAEGPNARGATAQLS